MLGGDANAIKKPLTRGDERLNFDFFLLELGRGSGNACAESSAVLAYFSATWAVPEISDDDGIVRIPSPRFEFTMLTG
jgi:hypothetical protein